MRAIKKEKVFDGKLLQVFTERKDMPNGRRTYIEKVEHPGAVLVVPFAGKKIVFIRQYRPVIGKYIWELPAGIIEKNETPYMCAKREITEETGYRTKELKRIGFIYTTPGFSDEKIHIYKAECDVKIVPQRDADEIIKVYLFDPDKVRKLFRNGKLSDSKTISALSFSGIFF